MMLNKSEKSGHTCLIPELKGNGFSYSPLCVMMLAMSLSYITFIMFRHIPSTPSFIRAFIMKGC
jgi:hypothetical protein